MTVIRTFKWSKSNCQIIDCIILQALLIIIHHYTVLILFIIIGGGLKRFFLKTLIIYGKFLNKPVSDNLLSGEGPLLLIPFSSLLELPGSIFSDTSISIS